MACDAAGMLQWEHIEEVPVVLYCTSAVMDRNQNDSKKFKINQNHP